MAQHPDIAAIVNGLRANNWTIAFAESCTGGRLSADMTTVPGSSAVVVGSAVCYQTRAKREVLGLEHVTEENVVSGETAEAMAEAARVLYGADIGVATTGYLDGERLGAFWAIYAPDLDGGTHRLVKFIPFPSTTPRATNREILVYDVMEALTRFAIAKVYNDGE